MVIKNLQYQSYLFYSGRFSSVERQLYEILLAVQKDLIEYLNSDNKTKKRGEMNRVFDQ